MISEEQLQLWASAPAATKFKYTHEEVREALANYLPDFAKSNHGYELKKKITKFICKVLMRTAQALPAKAMLILLLS